MADSILLKLLPFQENIYLTAEAAVVLLALIKILSRKSLSRIVQEHFNILKQCRQIQLLPINAGRKKQRCCDKLDSKMSSQNKTRVHIKTISCVIQEELLDGDLATN